MPQGVNSQLDNIRTATKVQLIKIIASKINPPAIWTQLRDNLTTTSIYTIWQNTLVAAKPYTMWATLDGLDEADRKAKELQGIQAYCLTHAHIGLTTELYTDIAEIANTNVRGEDECSKTVRKFKSRLDDYATALYNRCITIIDEDEYENSSEESLNDSNEFIEIYSVPHLEFSKFVTHNVRGYPISQGLKDLNLAGNTIPLQNAILHESAKRYLINQSLGSCGMHIEPLSGSVFMQPLFLESPAENLLANEHTRGTRSIFNLDPADADDEFQVTLEERMKDYIRTKSWRNLTNPRIFRNVRLSTDVDGVETPIDHNQTHNPSLGQQSEQTMGAGHERTGSQGGQSDNGNRTSGNANTSGPDQSPGPSSQVPPQPQVPDDDDYHPEIDYLTLFVLSKGYIANVKSKPATELFHDHMDRFRTTSEDPRVISRNSVRRGANADFFVMESTQVGIRQYVVTFTRKSRKPIFNLVQ